MLSLHGGCVKENVINTEDQLFLHACCKALLQTTKWTESSCVHIYFALSIKNTFHLLKHNAKKTTKDITAATQYQYSTNVSTKTD